ncbi:4-alpha-glucanotransferase [Frankia sp. AgB1.9]|uniref:4-alpha-glucanotransferase n=2 Tax=Frankia TaxID=1854 RepID=UPI001933E3FB|nr:MULTISPECIES: 4-alpha-glucanotransferase [unclassified Frankia]MBL7491636.1 4-alpha-glucanotransferase [Frankia sp. AgW1.1]MBL7553846.1 4-alpha-glucanotransferase [Frankia sp. AgB1.9]MBL7618018.1 4-alpha-glucanotransferase [Frankia sp. AgB1.8]
MVTSDDPARATTPRDPAATQAGAPRSQPEAVTADPAGPFGDVEPALARLAAMYGVATGYLDARDQPVAVPVVAVRRVLELMGVDTADPVAALAAAQAAPWRRLGPPSVVVKASAPTAVTLRLPAGLAPEAVRCELVLADGTVLAVTAGPAGERRELDGAQLVARPAPLPAGLPLGDHVLRVRAGELESTTQVVAVPDRVPEPTEPATNPARMWGWMVQLYALRSAGSWGMGDYADLATLAAWSGSAAGGRADVLLVNPLHAAAPTLPVQSSPYYPASRRFLSPLYLRPEDTPEYAAADPATRAAVDGHAAAAREAHLAADGFGELIDRDTVWKSKLAALELLFAWSPAAAAAGAGEAGAEVAEFALWCALAERHGPDWRVWPAELRDREPSALAAARAELADRVAFHRWLQARAEQQVAAAQAAAEAAGMRVGIVHDLAVGVDPAGADTWADRDAYAVGVSIGAPPDTFNQQGQDWGLPPWRPDRLAATGYAPLRRMIAAVLGRGGGLRVDHILGLFRLWWIPAGAGAGNGTYVRYDAEAMLGVLALEAAKAGALVVGEDLGTVEPTVATTLADFGVFGSSVLWFENDADGVPLPPAAWRARTMASVTTHDLPTAAGFLLGEHIRARAERGLLARPVAAETAEWRASRDALLAHLRAHGLLAPAAEPALEPETGDELAPELLQEAALGMHRLLVATPARIILAAPGDAVGDRLQPNLPSTVDSYPNWRLPVRDSDGRQVTLEELMADERVARLVAVLAEAAGQPGGPAASP